MRNRFSESAARRADGSRERRRHEVAIGDDKVRLGRAILDSLKDLRDPGYLEGFRLYAGLDPKPFTIHLRRCNLDWELPDSCQPPSIVEEFYIGVDGSLYMNIVVAPPEYREEFSNSPSERGDTILNAPEDFRNLSYGSIASLHEAVTSEGFFDRLAYRQSRRGKPGYGDIWALDADKGLRNVR